MGGIRGPANTVRHRVRSLFAATVAGTYLLLLIGIYTAASGAGLACDARWPLCDGPFGIFPANLPSFIEWSHRLVGLLVGLLILGSWWHTWQAGRSRRATAAMSAAVLLLPIQVWLGAQTVLTYELAALTAHFLTAVAIFVAIVLGAVWTVGRPGALGISHLLTAGTGAMVPFLLLKPQLLFVHTGPVQVAYYGLGFAVIGAMVIVAAVSTDVHWSVRACGAAVVLLLTVQLLAGRLVRSPAIHAIDWLATGATLLLLAVALGLTLRTPPISPIRRIRSGPAQRKSESPD